MSDLDQHLLGIAYRDQESFAQWMAVAEPAIRRGLSGFAHQVDVESVVQETLLRVWVVAPRHEPDGKPDSLLRLAIRISRNYAIDEVRRLRRERPLEDSPSINTDGDADALEGTTAVPDPLLQRTLVRCLRKLSGRPSVALAARMKASGESDRELAGTVGMAVNTFRQNVARGRRAIAACLARHGVKLSEVHQ